MVLWGEGGGQIVITVTILLHNEKNMRPCQSILRLISY